MTHEDEASPSNPSCIVDVGPHVIGPNIVTVKMSGKNKYSLWRLQMECLLKSQQMVGFINGPSPSPEEIEKQKWKEGDNMEAWVVSDSLVKGWILGSLSEEVARKAVNHLTHMQKKTDFSAKDLWEELQRSYGPSVVAFQKKSCGPSVCEQAAETKLSTRQAESEIIDTRLVERPILMRWLYGPSVRPAEIPSYVKQSLYDFIIKGETDLALAALLGFSPWDKLTNNGNTVLHVAVGSSTKNHHILLQKLLEETPKEKLLDIINSDGSSLLHVAAIGGNIEAVNMLVERNPELLVAKDKEGHTPLALSISNMHTKTSKCLFEHMKVHRNLLEQKEKEYDALLSGEPIMTCKSQLEQKYDALLSGKDINTSMCLLEQKEKEYDALFTGKSGEDLVILAISCQDFSLARQIIDDYDGAAILDDSDAVLTALAQNFPRELNFWERRDVRTDINRRTRRIRRADEYNNACWTVLSAMLSQFLVYFLVGFHAIVTAFLLFLKAIVRPFIKDTSQVYKDAKILLELVCFKIFLGKNSSTYHQYYNSSIFEATRRNSSTFIRIIIHRFPDAIWSTNEDGHNFIQYSVINRSEKIYNLLYEMSEHKNIYKTIKDSSGNTLLHLAARLALASKLNLISGAALQIQRELQWFKEVERFVCPLNQIQKNLEDETPQEVFTREHKGLVIEGEIWIKKTAESYTITAALIITIVFAAAITVPGGNNQESGIPIFTNNTAFKVFAISDAISLFTAVTSLLMFLSILTARFAEQDFLFKLPTKLIIGLTMLFISTTAMVIAFGATLFLVFGQRNLLTLIPIGALTCFPITAFMTLQCPLIVELISATYGGGFFVREKYDYFY